MSSHVGSRPVYLVRSGHCTDVDDMNRSVESARRLGKGTVVSSQSGPQGYKSNTVSGDVTDIPQSEQTSGEDETATVNTSTGIFASPKGSKIPSALTCNSSLSESGRRFGRRLHKFMCDQNTTVHGGVQAVPFASTTSRAVETASYLPHPPALHQQWSALNILDTGICHGLSVKTIREEMSEEFELWKKNPFLYRFPGGESILDMNRRMGDVVLEIERLQEPAVIVSHLSTIQSLVAYFTSLELNQIPFVSVPQHSVIMLTPNIYGACSASSDNDGNLFFLLCSCSLGRLVHESNR